MKALQLVEYGRFELVDLPIPAIGPEEVLVRVSACGICGSDVHGMDGSTGRRIPPIVMGHEAAGEIVELGGAVRDWKLNDRVTFDSTIYCGHCDHCLKGEINLCDQREVLGVSCAEFRRNGAFAEFVALPARVLYAVPHNLAFKKAAMVEPVSVALHGVRRSGAGPGSTVVVIGTGMIGLLVVQSLRKVGVKKIIAVDTDSGKRQKALKNGAHEALENSVGIGADIAIEVVGIDVTVQAAIGSVRKGGTVALIGNWSPSVTFPLQAVVSRELSLFGCCASRGEYPEALKSLGDGQIDVADMISATSSLEEAPAYFERLKSREDGLMKVMVCP